MDGTILQQGMFTSNGKTKDLNLRSDIDYMKIINLTIAGQDQSTAIGVEFFWQRGMPIDTGIEYLKSNVANAENLTKAMYEGGFTLLNTSTQTPGELKDTITAISNDAIPIVTNSGVNGLSAGDVVRLIDVASAQQLGGLDFTIGNDTLTDTTFSLDYMSQIVAGTTGSWRKINFDPQFYPTKRTITRITKAQNAAIVLSVKHGLTVGQAIKFKVDPIFGMSEINGLTGNIVSVHLPSNTITTDIDSSSFSTFAFPLNADVPFSRAEILPFGQAAVEAVVNKSDGATKDISIVGMRLGAGINSPAGVDGNEISWIAGKSSSVLNEY